MKNRNIKLIDVCAFVANTDKNKQMHLFLKLGKDYFSLRDGKKLKEYVVDSIDMFGNATVSTITDLQPIGKMHKLVRFFNNDLGLNIDLKSYLKDRPEFSYCIVDSEYYTTIKDMQKYEHAWNKRRRAQEKVDEIRARHRKKHDAKNKDFAKSVEDTYTQFKDGSMGR